MLFLLNFATFQIGWFSAVIGGAQQMPWLGPIVALIALTIHFYLARRPTQELLLILSCAAIGAAFDSMLVVSGWVQYTSGLFNESLAPYWIITMWMLFATTLNVSLRWLRGREALAAVFGLIGGPVTYLAGQKLGGITLVNEFAALAALAIGWAIIMPILLRLSEAFDGMADAQLEAAVIAREQQR